MEMEISQEYEKAKASLSSLLNNKQHEFLQGQVKAIRRRSQRLYLYNSVGWSLVIGLLGVEVLSYMPLSA